MELKPVPYNAVSDAVRTDLIRQLGDYSVALARITENRPETFEFLGSGTFVRRGIEHGILTAHHVLHRNKRPVQLGITGPDRILLFGKLNRAAEVPIADLEELPLGVPDGDYGEYGPDLTFIRFRREGLRSAIAATCSYWSLDRNPDEIIETFGVNRACIINTGYPAAKQGIRITTQHAYFTPMLYGGCGGLLQEDIAERDGWDFISSNCDYRAFPHLPESFDGMSGGGIWSALFRSDPAGVLQLHRFAMVGVCFWQALVSSEKPLLRGHFVRSIYGREWPR